MNRSSTKYRSYRVFDPLLLVFVLGVSVLYLYFFPSLTDIIQYHYEHKSYSNLLKYAERKHLGDSSDPKVIKYLSVANCLEGNNKKCSQFLGKLAVPHVTKIVIDEIINEICERYDSDKKDIPEEPKKYDAIFLTLMEWMEPDDVKKVGRFFISKRYYPKALNFYEYAYLKNKLDNEEISKALTIAWTQSNVEKINWLKRQLDATGGKDPKLKSDLLTLYKVEKKYAAALELLAPFERREDYEQAIFIYQESGRFEEAVDTYIQAYHQIGDISFLKKAYYLADGQRIQTKKEELLSSLSRLQEEFAFVLAEIEQKKNKHHAAMKIYYSIWQNWQNEQALQAAQLIAQEHNYRDEAENFLAELYKYTGKKTYYDALVNLFVAEKNTRKLRSVLTNSPDSSRSKHVTQILAYLYFQNKEHKKALETYWTVWNKWKQSSALENAYAAAIALKDTAETEKLLHLLYRETGKKQYLFDLKELYRGDPGKLLALLQKYPDYQEGRLLLVVYYTEKKEYSKAEKQLLLLLQQHPENVNYMHRAARLYIDNDQTEKAYPFCKKLYAQDEKYADMFFYAAEKKGGKIYLNALKNRWKKDADETIGFKLAIVYFDSQQYASSISIIEQLLEKYSKIKYRVQLAYAYEKNGQPAKKMELLKKMPLKKMPTDLALSFADMYLQKGQWRKSVDILQKWLKLHELPDERISALKHLAYLYNRMGEKKSFLQVNRRLDKILVAELNKEKPDESITASFFTEVKL